VTPAALIARARRRAGYTQAQLASRAGTSQPVISAYEHGKRDPTVSTLRRLLAAAGAQLELRTASLAATEVDEPAIARDHAAGLVDVLLLGDAIPFRRRGDLTFPRIFSS